jgi:hypothetical protein
MNRKTFETEMNRAKTMQRLEPERQDYWMGYQRGLRRAYHGDNFGIEAEHKLWLSLHSETMDDSRKMRGVGYRDGLKKGGE